MNKNDVVLFLQRCRDKGIITVRKYYDVIDELDMVFPDEMITPEENTNSTLTEDCRLMPIDECNKYVLCNGCPFA